MFRFQPFPFGRHSVRVLISLSLSPPGQAADPFGKCSHIDIVLSDTCPKGPQGVVILKSCFGSPFIGKSCLLKGQNDGLLFFLTVCFFLSNGLLSIFFSRLSPLQSTVGLIVSVLRGLLSIR